jgi:uncharacterized membrane protein
MPHVVNAHYQIMAAVLLVVPLADLQAATNIIVVIRALQVVIPLAGVLSSAAVTYGHKAAAAVLLLLQHQDPHLPQLNVEQEAAMVVQAA